MKEINQQELIKDLTELGKMVFNGLHLISDKHDIPYGFLFADFVSNMQTTLNIVIEKGMHSKEDN